MTVVAGRCFNRGLENNVVTLKDDVIRIHSFNKDGLGIYRNETNDINKSSASFVMNLNKHDYDVLSKFEQIKIKKDGETIKCTSGISNFQFQNNTDVYETHAAIKDRKEIGLNLKVFEKAASLVSKKNGVLIHSNGVCAYDEELQFLYKNTQKLDIETQIHAPIDVLRLREKDIDYVIKANNKIIMLQSAGELIYSSLFVKTNENLAGFDPKLDGEIKLENAEAFKNILTQAAGFNSAIYLEISGIGELTIQTIIAGEDPRVYTTKLKVETNLLACRRAFSIAGILKCLNAIETTGPVTLHVSDKMLRIDGDNEFVTLAAIRTPEDVAIAITEKIEGVE